MATKRDDEDAIWWCAALSAGIPIKYLNKAELDGVDGKEKQILCKYRLTVKVTFDRFYMANFQQQGKVHRAPQERRPPPSSSHRRCPVVIQFPVPHQALVSNVKRFVSINIPTDDDEKRERRSKSFERNGVRTHASPAAAGRVCSSNIYIDTRPPHFDGNFRWATTTTVSIFWRRDVPGYKLCSIRRAGRIEWRRMTVIWWWIQTLEANNQGR